LVDVWPCVLLLAALVTAALALLAFRPKTGFLLAWPFLLLAPTSSLVPVALQPMAEHRMYLPLAAVAAAVAVLLSLPRRRTLWIVALLLAAALGAATYHRNATYADEIELWRDTVEKRPANDRALTNLGAALLQHDRVAEARAPLIRAVELNQRNPEALTNLGFLHSRDGRLADAIDCFEQTVRFAPGLATAHYNLGCVLLKTGRIADAGKSFAQAIQLNPDYGDAHDNLGIILAAGGRFEAAVEHFSEALRVNPRDVEAYVNRAAAHLKLDRRANARADYQSALALRPDLADVRRQLENLQPPVAK
jgi:Flp pilus assembly protein TadD